jgi:hypothetical protein
MFEIFWNLNENEWEKAQRAISQHEPGSKYDRECSAQYYLLYADVIVRSGSSSLFARDGGDAISVSVLAFGYQLARVLLDIARTGRAQYSASDDDLEIYFSLQRGIVVIATNHFASEMSVPIDEFRSGCERFLIEVARSLRERAPQLLRWESVASIAAFAPS